MRLSVLTVGKLKAGPERDLVGRYLDRAGALGRGLGFSVYDLLEFPESRARRAPDRRADEARAILEHIPADAAFIAYDERGRADGSSEAIAERVGLWRDAARPALCIAIGGPDGLDDTVRARADLILAFGAATLPHGLVRVLVLEQVYRTLTILASHPYHRGEA